MTDKSQTTAIDRWEYKMISRTHHQGGIYADQEGRSNRYPDTVAGRPVRKKPPNPQQRAGGSWWPKKLDSVTGGGHSTAAYFWESLSMRKYVGGR